MKNIFLLESILNEVSIADLEHQWVRSEKMSREQFDIVVRTANNKSSWATWLGKRVLDGQLSLKEEDIDKWQNVIKVFERYKQRFPIKDINQIKTKDQISEFVQKAIDISSEMNAKDKATKAAKDEYAEFYKGTAQLDGKTFKVYMLPKGHKENYNVSRALAGDTHWCTASSNSSWYQDYIKDGNLIMFFNAANPKEKYQLHVERDQFMNILDRQIPWSSQFAIEACQWAVKKGLADRLPRRVQAALEFEKGLPPKEGAPKKEEFKVYGQGDIGIYYIDRYSLKEHYWAFRGIVPVSKDNTEHIGQKILILKGPNGTAALNYDTENRMWVGLEYYSDIDTEIEDKSLGISEESYKACLFLKQKYKIRVPEHINAEYNPNLKDPKEYAKATVGDLTIYEVEATDWGDAEKLRLFTDIGYYELRNVSGRSYILTVSPENLKPNSKSIQCIRLKNGRFHLNTHLDLSFEEAKAFVDHILRKEKVTLSDFKDTYPSRGEPGLAFFERLSPKFKVSDDNFTDVWLLPAESFKGAASLLNIRDYKVGSENNSSVLLVKVRNKYIALDHGGVASEYAETPRQVILFKNREIEPMRQLLAKYKIDCPMFEQGVKKYFPELSGASKEEISAMKSAPRVDKILEDRENEMRLVRVPLYKATNGRTIYLNREGVIVTTWDKVKYSFAKSTTQYTPIIEKWTQGSARVDVFLYWNYGAWNCTITRKNDEGYITGIIRKKGYGMGMNWDLGLKELPEDMQVKGSNLNEGFDSDQRRRMKQLAGIREPRSSKFGSTFWLDYLDRV